MTYNRTVWLKEQERYLRSGEVLCRLCGHGSDFHTFPENCGVCPNNRCQPRGPE